MDLDLQVRTAAFQFLDQQVRIAGEVLPLSILRPGFEFDGRRVPLMNAIQGIFKPAILPHMPLSITTVAVQEGEERPYDDLMTDAGLLYKYRGTDPRHPDNVGLRLAMERQRPLIYFHGIVPGQYFPEWPVYVVGDAPSQLTFTVNIDDRRLAAMEPAPDDVDTASRRRYVTRLVQQRAHQAGFRIRVIDAYRRHCAICRLRHEALLEAAHILPDGHPQGEPIVPNGMALCSLHHGAFDAHILTVTPRLSNRGQTGRARRGRWAHADSRIAGLSWPADSTAVAPVGMAQKGVSGRTVQSLQTPGLSGSSNRNKIGLAQGF